MTPSDFNLLENYCEPVLCIDVGGSAVKSWTFNSAMEQNLWETISDQSSSGVQRRDWDPKRSGTGLVEIIGKSVGDLPQHVAISIGGSNVSANGRNYHDWLTHAGRVPENLAEEVEKALKLPKGRVSIRSDSWAWAQGVRSFLRHNKKGTGTGVGLLVVGTGVAYSILTDTGVTIRHLHSKGRYDWKALSKFAKFDPGGWIHHHLGGGYFKWRDGKFGDLTDRREETRERYRLLFEELTRKDNVGAFIIAGGYADELEDCLAPDNLIFLTKPRICFDPGFIPMIGMLS